MRRIFCIAAVIAVMFSLVVPASAIEVGETELSGTKYGHVADAPSKVSGNTWTGFRMYYVDLEGKLHAMIWKYRTTQQAISADSIHFISGTDLNNTNYIYEWDEANSQWIVEGATVSGKDKVEYVFTGFRELIWVKEPIYYDDGETLFFPMTPLQRMMVAVERSLTTAASEVHGTMKILAVCGIICLASVVSLPLFGKVLYRFLS